MLIEFLFVIAFGLVFGSFVNVLIFRIPRAENIIFPSSHCQKCKKKINFLQNIPIFSFIFLKGKCKNCKNKISLIYPITEFFSALLAFFCFYHYGIYGIFAYFCVIFLYALSVIDFEYLEIPDSLNFLSLFCAIAFFSFESPVFLTQMPFPSFFESLICACVLMGFASFLRLFVGSLLKKEVMGEGDIIVFGSLGALLGLYFAFLSIFLAAFYALIFTLFYKKREIPFVPFLFLGCFSVFVSKIYF